MCVTGKYNQKPNCKECENKVRALCIFDHTATVFEIYVKTELPRADNVTLNGFMSWPSEVMKYNLFESLSEDVLNILDFSLISSSSKVVVNSWLMMWFFFFSLRCRFNSQQAALNVTCSDPCLFGSDVFRLMDKMRMRGLNCIITVVVVLIVFGKVRLCSGSLVGKG